MASYLVLSSIFTCLVIQCVQSHIKISSEFRQDESPACFDVEGCRALELESWFQELDDRKFVLKCDEGLAATEATADGKPLYELANDCNEPDAVWQYRYAGAKGKRKIFHGKGKLFFIKDGVHPPHGFDYGMKSGRCLKLHRKDVASIEGNFDNGILEGEAELTFFDGKVSKMSFKQGVINGIMRKYVGVTDKTTNLQSGHRLYSISRMGGISSNSGIEWILRENGVSLLRHYDQDSKALAMIRLDGEIKLMVGTEDQEADMMTQAREARILGLEERHCIKVPIIEAFGPTFDYDLQIKSTTKVTVAKLVRFFEIVADETVPLEQNFEANKAPVDKAVAVPILKLKTKDKYHWRVEVFGEALNASYEGVLDENGQPMSFGHFKILSEFVKRDLIGSNNASDNAANDTESVAFDEYLDQYVPLSQLPVNFPRRKVSIIQGIFKGGQLSGLVKIVYTDGSVLEGITSDGVFHGITRELAPPFKTGKRKRYVRRQLENKVISASGLNRDEPIAEVVFVGSYKNGFLDGPGWKFLIGGSFLFGTFTQSKTFTTNQGAYISQDLETGYFGRFIDGKMIAGQVANITGQETIDGIKVPKFSEPEGKMYRFLEQGSESSQMTDPLVTDPIEDRWVEVGLSDLGPEAGQGLFAKRDIPESTVFAFFGGLRINATHWNATKPYEPNYWIKTDEGDIIHLPEEYGRDTHKYKATLGHKINHSFSKWNCIFHTLDHPRFGPIPAARSTENVRQGTELLCLYEMKFHEGQSWYQELWRKEVDNDSIDGPFGHRGEKKNVSQAIEPMLSNGTLYAEFYRHAVEVLQLEPVT